MALKWERLLMFKTIKDTQVRSRKLLEIKKGKQMGKMGLYQEMIDIHLMGQSFIFSEKDRARVPRPN